MKWHKLSLNPQALEDLYDEIPDLESVNLFSINLCREGSSIQVKFDLPQFPECPPKKWHEDVNTVQLKLAFWSITDFEARGWQSDMKVNVKIEKNEDLIKVILSNSKIDLRFSFFCENFRIDNISAYQKSDC